MTDRFGGVNPFQPLPAEPAPPTDDRFGGKSPFARLDAEGRPIEPYVPKNPGALAREEGETDWSGSGAAKNVATGAIKGGAGTIGLADVMWSLISPRNAYDRASTIVDYVHGPGTYAKRNPEMAEIARKRGWLDATGLTPSKEQVEKFVFDRTGAYEPESLTGKVAQSAVEFGTGAVTAPMGAPLARVAAAAPTAVKAATAVGRELGKEAAVGSGVGVGVGLAQESSYLKDSPVGQLAAGLAGAAGVTAGGKLLGATANKAGEVIQNFRGPRTVEGQRAAAGQILRDVTTDPDKVATALAVAEDTVPGSRRLTAPTSNDRGLQQFERTLRTDDPLYRSMAVDRQKENSAARLSALDEVQTTGNPQAVRQFLAESFDTLRRVHDDTVEIMGGRARDANEALGSGANAEAAGSRMREILAGRYAAAKRLTGRLYRALEERNPELRVDNLRQGVADIYGKLSPEEMLRLHNDERQFVSLIGGYGETLSFKRLRSLESNINTALRDARKRQRDGNNGAPEVIQRLTRLRASLEDTYGAAVENTATREAQAVAAGTMRQEDTLGAFLAKLKAEADDFLARSEAGYRLDLGADGTIRTRSVPAGNGAEIPGRPGGDGVAGEIPGGVFDQQLKNELVAARAARRNQGNVFERRSVGEALKGDEFSGEYTMRAGMVPNQFFKAGPDGGARIEEYMRAAGPRGGAILTDYAVESMRNAALKDGVIDPERLAAWAKRHEAALSRMPELRQRLTDAAKATEAMEEAAVARRVALDTAKASLVGKILGLSDASADGIGTYVATEMARPNGVDSMRNLMARLADDEDAVDGLRRTVLDYIMKRTGRKGAGEIESLHPQTFKNFVFDNKAALSEIYTPDQMKAINNISEDIIEYQKWVDADKLPGTPQTAADLIAGMAKRANERPLPSTGQAMMEGFALGAGFGSIGTGVKVAASSGAANWVLKAIRKIRGEGMQKVDDLLREAMLDPKLAAELLKPAPPVVARTNRGLMGALAPQTVFTHYQNQDRDE